VGTPEFFLFPGFTEKCIRLIDLRDTANMVYLDEEDGEVG